MSTLDFSSIYTTLPHNLIKEKITELIEQTFNTKNLVNLACNEKLAFFTLNNVKDMNCGHVRKCVFGKIFIRFGSKSYRQIVGSLMGTNCALIADLICCVTRETVTVVSFRH